MAKLSSLVVDLQVETAELKAGLEAANKKLEKFGDQVDAIAKSVTAAFTFKIVEEAGKKLAEFISHGAELADQMGKMAQRTGIGVEALSGLSYAASLSDVSSEQLSVSLNHLNKNIVAAANGGKQQALAFDTLGVKTHDAAGNIRGAGDVLGDIAAKFAGMKDGAQKAAVAQEVFGKSGAALIPLLNQGRDGIAAMTEEARAFGLIVTAEGAAASEQFNDSLRRLKAMGEGVAVALAQNLAPSLNALTEDLIASTKETNALKEASDALAIIIRTLASGAVLVAGIFQELAMLLAALAAGWIEFSQRNFKGALEGLKGYGHDAVKVAEDTKQRIEAIWSQTTGGPGKKKAEADTGGGGARNLGLVGEVNVTAQSEKNARKRSAAAEKAKREEDEHYKWIADYNERQRKYEQALIDQRVAADATVARAYKHIADMAKQEEQKARERMQQAVESTLAALDPTKGLAQSLASGDILGAVVQLVSMSKQFKDLVDALSRIMQVVSNVIGVVLEPMLLPINLVATALEALEPALLFFRRLVVFITEPMKLLGEIAMPLLWSVLKGIAWVILAVARALAGAWNGIMEAVAGVLNDIGDALGPLGGPLHDLAAGFQHVEEKTDYDKAMTDLVNTTYDAASAHKEETQKIREVNEAISNVPTWFKVNAARFGAANAGGNIGAETGMVAVYLDGGQIAARIEARQRVNSFQSGGSSAGGG